MLTKGFTIVELLVVMAVSGVLLGLLFGPLDSLYQSNTTAIKQIGQIADTRSALHQIAREVTDSIAFYTSTSSPPADLPTISSPLGVNNSGTDWSWTGADANHRVLITSTYATTAAPGSDTSGNRNLIYSDPSCNATTAPLKNFFVYFVSGTTLYRRTIQNTSASYAIDSAGNCTSATIAQKQSCAIANMSDSKCKAVDTTLASNVTSFTVDYYQDAKTSPITGEYDPNTAPTAPSSAQSIGITLTVSTASGTQTSSIRVAPENG